MTDNWTCPVCGPTLTIDTPSGRVCIRHGDQGDINDDPDLEKYHSSVVRGGQRSSMKGKK